MGMGVQLHCKRVAIIREYRLFPVYSYRFRPQMFFNYCTPSIFSSNNRAAPKKKHTHTHKSSCNAHRTA